MFIDVTMSLVVLLVCAAILAALAPTHIRAVRPWLWLALLEHVVASIGQLIYSRVIVHGGDTFLYSESGAALAKLLDANFDFVFPELTSLFFQRPSIFDQLVYGGGGTNTGSMHAAVAFLVYILGGSEFAAHAAVSGLAMFGTFSIFKAFHRSSPQASPIRLFIATVMLPSTVFWTSALHKESFAILGIGIVLAGWRATLDRQWGRAVLLVPIGAELIFLFRAPALPPLLLGFVMYFLLDRVRRVRGAEVTVVGPLYFVAGLAILAIGMIAVSKLVPSLGIDKLGETVATKQQGWAANSGASSFTETESALPESFAGNVVRVPVAFVNALFRPQLFDVNNFGALLSALEMTTITIAFVQAVRYIGLGGIYRALQSSPLILMCAVVATIGCTFVGLVTLNFGSLARYRVPFLPFYGAVLVGLVDRADAAKVAAQRRARAALLPANFGRRRPT